MRPSSPFAQSHLLPSTRASDISRLLDPSYTSSSPPSQSVYVDHHGDLHDPDYRDFLPIQQKRAPATRFSPARPPWDTVDDDALSDDEYEYESHEDDFFHESQSPSSRRSSYQHPAYAFTSRDYRTPHFPSYQYNYGSHSPEPSPPTSFDSYQDDDASPFASAKEKRCSVKFHLSSHKTRLVEKEKATQAVRNADEIDATSWGVDPDQRSIAGTEANVEGSDQNEEEWTPTCAQSMSRQWQAISLRFRIGVFRAQRRIRSRLSGS